jgi:hypothetical protein
VEEVLLQGRGNGGLARGGEARQPDCEAALGAQLVALAAGEGGMPGDVAVDSGVSDLILALGLNK